MSNNILLLKILNLSQDLIAISWLFIEDRKKVKIFMTLPQKEWGCTFLSEGTL